MQKPQVTIQDGWLSATKIVPSPHFDSRPNQTDISLLVIHYISLPPGKFGNRYINDFFQGKLDNKLHPYFDQIKDLRVSAHCLINREGNITQYVNFNNRAWHAGISCFDGKEKCNDFSIGIELEGSNEQAFTNEQYISLISLTKEIQRTYPLITHQRIVGHCHISPGRKIDPGQYFDWNFYLEHIE